MNAALLTRMTIEQKLRELGIELPRPVSPVGRYRPWLIAGDLLFISGQLPLENGAMRYRGKVGSDLGEAEGRAAARLCAVNVLAQIRDVPGGFDRLKELVRVDGHVASAPGWSNQHRVLDGASELFAEVLQDRAGHVRTAFGQASLPLDAAVELVVIVALKG